MKPLTGISLTFVAAIVVALEACSPMPGLGDLKSATRSNSLDPGGTNPVTLGRVWTTTSAPMTQARAYFGSTVFGSPPAIFVLGGSGDPTGVASYKDFSSFDGTTWTPLGNPGAAGGKGVVLAMYGTFLNAFGGTAAMIPIANTEQYSAMIWSPSPITSTVRSTSAGLRYGTSVYLIGGQVSSITPLYTSDMDYFTDGIPTINMVTNDGLGQIDGHQAVVFLNKIFVIGGTDGTTVNAKVSTSTGGAFTQLVNAAPFGPRTDFALAANSATMYLIGGKNASGTALNDVWITTDGTNWTQLTINPPFTPRFGMRAEFLNGKLYLMGGIIGSGSNATNEVWVSQ